MSRGGPLPPDAANTVPPLASTIMGLPLGSSGSPMIVEANGDRKSTRLNSSHVKISYAVFCLKKKELGQGMGIASRRQANGSGWRTGKRRWSTWGRIDRACSWRRYSSWDVLDYSMQARLVLRP